MWGRMASCGRLAIGLWFMLIAAAHASVPVRDACSEDARIVANVQETDAIQVRHAVSGESLPCYAVQVGEVRGYIVNNTLSVI